MASSASTRLRDLRVGPLGILSTAVLTGGIVFFAQGIIQTQEIQIVNQDLTISGTGTTSTQVFALKRVVGALVQTGVLIEYDTLSLANPTTQTGHVTLFCVDVATIEDSTLGTFDCTVETNASTTTGGTTLFLSEDFGVRGVHCADLEHETEVLVGPDERIKCGTSTSTGNELVGTGVMYLREVEL